MTTIAKKKPAEFRTPVYVTESSYEVWYAQPRSLGIIERRGSYWYTQDGMRFAASRDAMDYLVRIETLRTGGKLTDIVRKEVAASLNQPRVDKQKGATVSEKQGSAVLQHQNHPAFQEFLEFLEFRSRRKGAGAVDTLPKS